MMPDRTDGPHDEAEELLPWYATGQLDQGDQAVVERHLASCASCRRQLSEERRLAEEFQAFDPQVDSGWALLRARIDAPAKPRFDLSRPLRDLWAVLSRPAVAALATAQIAFVVLAGATLLSLSRPTYHALGAAQAPAAANVIVMFRADATEEDIRHALRESGASLVGGPTSANAYLLHVALNRRPSALTRLQSDDQVQLAQPIDETPQ
jgi:anti-sigma factor RsiW